MSAMYTKRNEEEYITDREGQKLLHFMPSLSLIPPSISLSPWASTSPNPAWVTDTQGKVCVRVCVCTCAVVYKQDVAAIRRNPICSGGGKKKKKKDLHESSKQQTHTCKTEPKQAHKDVLTARTNENPVYSLVTEST